MEQIMSHEDFLDFLKKPIDPIIEIKEEEKVDKSSMEYQIERGRELVIEEQKDNWESYVRWAYKWSPFYGREIFIDLKIMELLNKDEIDQDDIDNAIWLLKEKDYFSVRFGEVVAFDIICFHKNGERFFLEWFRKSNPKDTRPDNLIINIYKVKRGQKRFRFGSREEKLNKL